jgi:hypothetical protein
MRFPWQPRESMRTCAECGCTWRVPRWAGRRRVRSISMISVASRTTIDRRELAREVESGSEANRRTEAFRRCPKCGADHFTQRALRGESPGLPISQAPGSIRRLRTGRVWKRRAACRDLIKIAAPLIHAFRPGVLAGLPEIPPPGREQQPCRHLLECLRDCHGAQPVTVARATEADPTDAGPKVLKTPSAQ